MHKYLYFLVCISLAHSAGAVRLVEEHFATSSDTVNNVPGWTAIYRFEDQAVVGQTSELLTGGLTYGGTVTGVGKLAALDQDGYIHNDAAVNGNRFYKPLESPINFSEGSILYFSAIIKGTKRANFGLASGITGTDFPEELISIGVNPQISTTEKNMAESFNSSVWLGSLQKGNAEEITVPSLASATRLIIGRLVNNVGVMDEISYHIIDLSSSVNVPSNWTSSALSGEDGFYSKTDYDFGGDQVFSDLVVNLQNYSGLDEIYFGTTYTDVVPGATVSGLFMFSGVIVPGR